MRNSEGYFTLEIERFISINAVSNRISSFASRKYYMCTIPHRVLGIIPEVFLTERLYCRISADVLRYREKFWKVFSAYKTE